MKPRHVAGLVLVGWYLMVPSITISAGEIKMDRMRVLRHWLEGIEHE